MVISAHQTCHQILDQLKVSQLNFKITETPYSAHVIVRKRFIKDSEGPHHNFPTSFPSVQIEGLQSRNDELERENLSLSDTLKTYEDTIRLLEGKLDK